MAHPVKRNPIVGTARVSSGSPPGRILAVGRERAHWLPHPAEEVGSLEAIARHLPQRQSPCAWLRPREVQGMVSPRTRVTRGERERLPRRCGQGGVPSAVPTSPSTTAKRGPMTSAAGTWSAPGPRRAEPCGAFTRALAHQRPPGRAARVADARSLSSRMPRRTVDGKTSTEQRYFISSQKRLRAKDALATVRARRGIENAPDLAPRPRGAAIAIQPISCRSSRLHSSSSDTSSSA